MEQKTIYADIANRTGGHIYIGVVGPVRTGKSTSMTRSCGRVQRMSCRKAAPAKQS